MLTDSVSVAPNHTPMESQQPEQGGQPTQNEYPTPATPGSEIEHKYVPTMSSAPPSNLNSSIINAAATASAIVNSNPHSTSPVDRKPIMPPSSLAHGSVSLNLKVFKGRVDRFQTENESVLYITFRIQPMKWHGSNLNANLRNFMD